MRVLEYSLSPNKKLAAPITLDLFEAESYYAAVVVQQLVGNLVYYSNYGRYEPRLAESWNRTTPNTWVFKLKRGLKCENGEEITSDGFKASLQRSILALSKGGSLPVFGKLAGYQQFLKEKGDLPGIVANGQYLEFQFVSPIRTGLIQYLSFAPFGYICSENLNSDGTWRDPLVFISSGAYKIKKIELGKSYVLERRLEWDGAKDDSPDLVNVIHEFPSEGQSSLPAIIDSNIVIDSVPPRFVRYPLVPEYLNAVLLGNFEKGFFKNQLNRKALKAAIDRQKKARPVEWKNHVQSSTFYTSQKTQTAQPDNFDSTKVARPDRPLRIAGSEPDAATSALALLYTWPILKAALHELGWPYEFANNAASWAESTSQKYDLRMRSPSIGGGFEAWGLSVLFCTSLGSGLPDPTGEICKLVSLYEADGIEEDEMAEQFFEIVERETAILPVTHYGAQWYLSPEIDTRSISPLVSVIRFDQVQLK